MTTSTHDDVPRGTVHEGEFAGAAYPGASHRYAVYLPAHHDGSALPVSVFLDGLTLFQSDQVRATTVLDDLIAQRRIPPMMGVFVDPGTAAALGPDQQARWERSVESDAVSDRLSRFRLDELIPVAEAFSPVREGVEDAAILGISSGAVGAFMAAWHRPDRIRRVGSFIGTYLAIRGGDEIAGLVRRTEPRPLRIRLHAGEFDHVTSEQPYGVFNAGHWLVANQALYHGLRYAGYDVSLTVSPGGHDLEYPGALLPEFLADLWAGWDAAGSAPTIVARPPAEIESSGWETRGNVWSLIDEANDWEPSDAETAAAVFESDRFIATPDGIRFSDGRMLLPDFSATRVLWDGGDRIYVLETGTSRLGVIHLSSLSPSIRWHETRLTAPSAFALSPDHGQLIVGDSASRHQWSFQLDADGQPLNGEPFFRLETLDDAGGATDVATDSTGGVLFATALGIQVCEAIGRVTVILNPPRPNGVTTSVAFGGENLDRLYVVHDGEAWSRHMRVHAVRVDQPAMPDSPPL